MENTPIRDLQQMLRVLSLSDSAPEERITPDGIYGNDTRQAVMRFQSAHHLPVTGIADDTTYQAIRDAYDQISELRSPAQGCVIHFPGTLSIAPGQSHPHLFVLQGMLLALRETLHELPAISVNGVLDSTTEDALKQIQRCAGLPETGQLDKVTWNRVCMLYRALFDRYHAPSQG